MTTAIAAPAAPAGPVPLAITDLDQYRKDKQPPGPEYPQNMRSFYSPRDDVHGALEAVIGCCRHTLIVAMYGYDDDRLAEMIAHLLEDPSIYVQITLDKSQAGGVHERAILDKYKNQMTGNSVAIGSSEKGAIMHRKMVLVDGLWRISGSTNWSTSGETLQDNELTVTQSAAVCAEAMPILAVAHDTMLARMAKAAAPK